MFVRPSDHNRRRIVSLERRIQSVDASRLVWVGPLTVLTSIAAVLGVRFVAVAVLHPESAFGPLTAVPVIVDTAVLVTLAVVVFHRIATGRELPGPLQLLLGWRFATLDPVSAYRALAVRVLLLSFLPDVAIAVMQPAKWLYAAALAAMHVTAWAITVSMLTRLTRSDEPHQQV